MEQSELLRYVARVLEEMGIPYFVTGSTATIYYGEPRFTNDIDLVVDLSESQVIEFCRRFPHEEFYLSETAASDAVRRKTQFNILHPASGLKVDVIVPQLTPFNQSRFARSRRLPTGNDFDAFFASPEDVIIKKMEYYQEGGSEKHLRDILGVLKTTRDQIDLEYIEKWTKDLGLQDIWRSIRKRISE